MLRVVGAAADAYSHAMLRLRVFVVCGLAACNGPLFAQPDPVYVYRAPPAAPAPATPPPAVRSPEPAPESCKITTELEELKSFFGELPPGVSEDAMFNAALQFLVSAGEAIDSQNPVARTIITKRGDGQTIVSTCNINRYFMYTFNITIVGARMIVGANCWTSIGWEAHVSEGILMPRNRGELKPCDVPQYVAKNDAQMPRLIFEGAVGMTKLDKLAHPDEPPEPTPEEVRHARWWCTVDGLNKFGACTRTRKECEQQRNTNNGTALTKCTPRSRAACFDFQANSAGVVKFCSPTMEACREMMFYAEKRSADGHIGKNCEEYQ